MKPMKVFVASSSESKPLVDAFETELKVAAKTYQLKIELVPWYRDGAFEASGETLGSLIDQCRGKSPTIRPSDFLVVFLTQDDKETKHGEKRMVARDNCILELGLFIGGLGLEPQRCFALSNLKLGDIPSDLRGRTLIPIKRPAKRSARESYEKAVRSAAKIVRNRMRDLGPYLRPTECWIDAGDLQALEKSKPKGHLNLRRAPEVLVKSAQPLESKSRNFALQVNRNMRAGVKYTYYLDGTSSLEVLAAFFQRLVTAGLSGQNAPELLNSTRTNADQVLANLRCLKDNLRIYLLPSKPPLAICVHNPNSAADAKCYFRHYKDWKFMSWCGDSHAVDIAKELKDLRPPDPSAHDSVFRSTVSFSVDQVRADLLREISKLVHSKLMPKIEEVCFGKS